MRDHRKITDLELENFFKLKRILRMLGMREVYIRTVMMYSEYYLKIRAGVYIMTHKIFIHACRLITYIRQGNESITPHMQKINAG